MSRSLSFAYARGWNLALTLMVCTVVFRTGTDAFGVMETREYDGNPALVVHEFDPHRT